MPPRRSSKKDSPAKLAGRMKRRWRVVLLRAKGRRFSIGKSCSHNTGSKGSRCTVASPCVPRSLANFLFAVVSRAEQRPSMRSGTSRPPLRRNFVISDYLAMSFHDWLVDPRPQIRRGRLASMPGSVL